MSEREELIKELKQLPSIQWLIGYFSEVHDVSIKRLIEEELTNFVIEERRRICAPLIKGKKELMECGLWNVQGVYYRFDEVEETLKLAGLNEGTEVK